MSDVQDASGGGGLGGAVGSCAACAGLALGEIEDAGGPAAGVHGKQRATAGLLYVVTVRGDGEDVQGRA